MSVLASDWTKIRTVRSTIWTLLLTAALGVGISFLIGLSFSSAYPNMSPERQARFDPLFATFYSLSIAQLAIVVFAVLAVGSEYSSGTIRTSLLAVPRRGTFFASKVVAIVLPVIAVAALTVFGAFAVAQAALGAQSTTLGAPGVPRTVAGAFIYLVLIALFATGVAMMLRSSTLSLGILLPIFFLGSQGLGNIPAIRTVTQYLPDQAGLAIVHIFGPPEAPDFTRDYGPWTGIAILGAWTVAALIGGYAVLRRRDA